MKAVMKSVSPRICEKIANGDCTILVSKTAPKCKEPFKGYIYATEAKKWFHSGIIVTSDELLWLSLSSGKIKMCDGLELWADGEDYQCVNGKVIGEFVCDKIIKWQYNKGHQYYVEYPDDCTSYFPYLKCHSDATGLRCSEIENYGKGKSKTLYGWHISDLKIYDKPKELREFSPICSYKNDDSSCQYHKVDCLYQRRDYNTDGSVNLVTCDKSITRAPSNWQYVEGLEK